MKSGNLVICRAAAASHFRINAWIRLCRWRNRVTGAIFRIEALPVEQSALLRPGMRGVAKVRSDSAILLWIWTHGSSTVCACGFWSPEDITYRVPGYAAELATGRRASTCSCETHPYLSANLPPSERWYVLRDESNGPLSSLQYGSLRTDRTPGWSVQSQKGHLQRINDRHEGQRLTQEEALVLLSALCHRRTTQRPASGCKEFSSGFNADGDYGCSTIMNPAFHHPVAASLIGSLTCCIACWVPVILQSRVLLWLLVVGFAGLLA